MMTNDSAETGELSTRRILFKGKMLYKQIGKRQIDDLFVLFFFLLIFPRKQTLTFHWGGGGNFC